MNIFGWIGLLVFLSGCAINPYVAKPDNPTSYGPRYGFSEQNIGKGVYKISYYGTTHQIADDMVMARASILALKDGYSYFVVDEKIHSDKDFKYYNPAGKGGYHMKDGTYAFAGSYETIKDAQVDLQIHCYESKPSGVNKEVYDARAVRAEMGSRYKITDEQ